MQTQNFQIDRGSDWTQVFQFASNPQPIVGSTNASPIVVTIPQHGFTNGQAIRIYGHNSNKPANGNQTAENVTADTFELLSTTGTGIGTAQGYAAACIDATGGSIVCELKDDYANPLLTVQPDFAWIDQTRCRFSLTLTHVKIATVTTQKMYFDIFFVDAAGNRSKRLSGVMTFVGSISES